MTIVTSRLLLVLSTTIGAIFVVEFDKVIEYERERARAIVDNENRS